MHISDTFTNSIDPRWTQVSTGGGILHITGSTLRMGFTSAKQGHYTDVQIDDYTMLARKAYFWKPPVRMITGEFAFWSISPSSISVK